MSDKPDPIIIMIEPNSKHSLEAARLVSLLDNHDLPIIVADRSKQPVTGRLIILHAIASTLTLAEMMPRMLEDFNISSKDIKNNEYIPTDYSTKFQRMAAYKPSLPTQHVYPIFRPHCTRLSAVKYRAPHQRRYTHE
jgi:hypothetical protein